MAKKTISRRPCLKSGRNSNSANCPTLSAQTLRTTPTTNLTSQKLSSPSRRLQPIWTMTTSPPFLPCQQERNCGLLSHIGWNVAGRQLRQLLSWLGCQFMTNIWEEPWLRLCLNLAISHTLGLTPLSHITSAWHLQVLKLKLHRWSEFWGFVQCSSPARYSKWLWPTSTQQESTSLVKFSFPCPRKKLQNKPLHLIFFSTRNTSSSQVQVSTQHSQFIISISRLDRGNLAEDIWGQGWSWRFLWSTHRLEIGFTFPPFETINKHLSYSMERPASHTWSGSSTSIHVGQRKILGITSFVSCPTQLCRKQILSDCTIPSPFLAQKCKVISLFFFCFFSSFPYHSTKLSKIQKKSYM